MRTSTKAKQLYEKMFVNKTRRLKKVSALSLR